MSKTPEQSFNISELQWFAGSDAGKALISLLKSNGGAGLNSALEKASRGDSEDARKVIEALLSTKEARDLLNQMGVSNGK